MNNQLNKDASILIKFAANNRPDYIWEQLKARGINKNKFLPSGSELESQLYELFLTNKQDFLSLLKGLKVDSTKTNDSTRPETINSIKSMAYSRGLIESSITTQEAFDHTVSNFEVEVESDSTQSTNTSVKVFNTSTNTYIAYAVGALILITLLFLIFKK